MKKALALCGGGGKGSFQIGVWKAFTEKKLDTGFHAVSGTSVGALNAVLFALGDYEKAEKIWNSVSYKKMMSLSRKGTYFSRDGLTEFISEIDLSRLDESRPDVFVTTYSVSEKKAEYFKLNGMRDDEKIAVLLASSAMPVVYESVEINGFRHRDGGYIRSENVPIEPLFLNGYRNIWIVSLECGFNIHSIAASPLFSRPDKRVDIIHRYPGCEFEIIKPLRNISGLFNIRALDFSQKGIYNRMEAGYIDTIRILENEGVHMKKNTGNINFAINRKMKSLFKNQRELENFIKCANFGKVNLEVQTMGGKLFWNNIVELFGWVVQQRWKSAHYRILDHNHVRKAWTTNPTALLEALEVYEKAAAPRATP